MAFCLVWWVSHSVEAIDFGDSEGEIRYFSVQFVNLCGLVISVSLLLQLTNAHVLMFKIRRHEREQQPACLAPSCYCMAKKMYLYCANISLSYLHGEYLM